MTREIPLTQGKVALVDDEDFDRVNAFKWCAVRQQTAPHRRAHWYAKRCIAYEGKAINVYLHRFILGTPDPIQIDHEDGNGLNCTKSNMRYASRQQNTWNTRVNINSESGFKGVVKAKYGWAAKIAIDGKQRTLGTFATAEEAARVWDAAARHIHGAFARTSFSDADPKAENIFRRWLDGERFTLGKNPLHKLTDDMVREMRRRYADGGVVIRELAADFGVSSAAATFALSGRTFKHITDVPPLTGDKRKPEHRMVHLTPSREAEAA